GVGPAGSGGDRGSEGAGVAVLDSHFEGVCPRIPATPGVSPRTGMSPSLQYLSKHIRPCGRHVEQGANGAGWRASPLFPFLKPASSMWGLGANPAHGSAKSDACSQTTGMKVPPAICKFRK